MPGLTGLELILLILSALIIGFSKTGISGATLPAVAMVAYTFGGKTSSGFMLLMLIIGDIYAVIHYRRNINFKDILKVLPPAVIGILLGAFIGRNLSDTQFKLLMGVIVTLCLVLLIYNEVTKKAIKLPDHFVFHGLVGILSGFASMVGNAAGPIFSVYLLSMSFDKTKFIGTTAWFFFFVNLIKVPFQIFVWDTIHLDTLKLTATMLPFILLGGILGILFVKKINERLFKILVIIMTALSALRLML